MPDKHLNFSVNDGQFRFKAKLLGTNRDLVAALERTFPLTTLTTHVVISGETIGMPTKILYLDQLDPVQRVIGSVYFYAPTCGINICYGEITESARVNQFAQIRGEDMPTVKEVGKLVWRNTVLNPVREPVVVEISIGE
ncbi:MAG: hypothetical protein ACRYG5_14775 [Janthinobacterium lividum]